MGPPTVAASKNKTKPPVQKAVSASRLLANSLLKGRHMPILVNFKNKAIFWKINFLKVLF
jgi:hypothetical protein